MPINYKEYPDNWKWLSRQIIKDAGNRCELCYAPNGELVVRDKKWKYPWCSGNDIDVLELDDGEGNGGKKLIRVVLTVHHIDSNKKNSKKQNLIALCQRCHLRLDLQKHLEKRSASYSIGKKQYSLIY